MARCKRLEDCQFFNDALPSFPATAEMFKSHYCLRNHSRCARYMVQEALGRGRVPEDLFPNQVVRAKVLIARGA